MTPKEYYETIDRLRASAADLDCRADAFECKARWEAEWPELRPAKPDDIKEGVIVYYPGAIEDWDEDGNPLTAPGFFKVVGELGYYGDDRKAYLAEDGCRYGLNNAHVEVVK